MGHPDSGIVSSVKRHKLSNHEKTGGNLKCILLSKRKGYILYDSEKTTFYMIPTQ
jgi:hypothetical protein